MNTTTPSRTSTKTRTKLIALTLAAASSLIGAETPATHAITSEQGRIVAHETTNPDHVKRFILGRGWSAAHFVFGGGEWQTTIAITNSKDTPKTVTLLFVDDEGFPLSVPLLATGRPATRVDLEISPNATLFVDTDDKAEVPGTWGSALLFQEESDYSGLASQLVFRQRLPGGQTAEGTVPFEAQGASKCNGPLVMQYDEAFGFVMGFALANLDPNTATTDVEAYNSRGQLVGSAAVTLPSGGHDAWVLNQLIPATRNLFGHLKISRRTNDCNGQVGAIGLRFSPTGSFTTVFPMLDKGPGEIAASKPEFSISLTLDQTVYVNHTNQTAPVLRGRLTLRNSTPTPFTLNFNSSQQFEFVIRDSQGNVKYRWSAGKNFTFGNTSRQIGPGDTSWTVDVSLPAIGIPNFQSGFYTAEASLPATNALFGKPSPTGFSASVGFEVQVDAVFVPLSLQPKID